MPAPRTPRRKKNGDHVVDFVLALEEAEVAIKRIDDATLDAAGRNAVHRMNRAIRDGKDAAADAIESMSEGTLARTRTTAQPMFSDRNGTR